VEWHTEPYLSMLQSARQARRRFHNYKDHRPRGPLRRGLSSTRTSHFASVTSPTACALLAPLDSSSVSLRGALKGRVFLTSTTASSRHDGVTCSAHLRILSLRTSSRYPSGTNRSSVEELCRRTEIPSADAVLCVDPTPTWTRFSAPSPSIKAIIQAPASGHLLSGASVWRTGTSSATTSQAGGVEPASQRPVPPTPPIPIPALRDQATLTQLIDQV
jgi:hypothetical protein